MFTFLFRSPVLLNEAAFLCRYLLEEYRFWEQDQSLNADADPIFHRFYSSGFGAHKWFLIQFWEFRRSRQGCIHFSSPFSDSVDQTDSMSSKIQVCFQTAFYQVVNVVICLPRSVQRLHMACSRSQPVRMQHFSGRSDGRTNLTAGV